MLDMYQVETRSSSPNEFDWVDRHADYLYRFALSRLHNETTAEDLVQETLLAALRSRQDFAKLSSERTWLTGILKHKIYDYFRSIYRETAHENNSLNEDFFDTAGHWKTSRQSKWHADPLTLLEQKEFQEVLQKCLAMLPERLACVFTLSEIENLSGEEICRLLNISPNNFWTILHRARLCLRESLEQSWFNGKPNGASNCVLH